jgi:hypothetical protein
VALERVYLADIEPEPSCFDQHLGEGGNIAQAEIEALAGDWMDAMRHVASERRARRDIARRMMQRQRSASARSLDREPTERIVEPGLHFGRECRVVEPQQLPAAAAVSVHTTEDKCGSRSGNTPNGRR